MRRIRDRGENETLENAQEAFERYAYQKHNRWNISRYEEHLDENTLRVQREIIEETFVPQGYQEKWIYDKKPRKLAKAPVYDHHSEAAHILPYEKQVYDRISWRAPAVRPGLGTHAMMRFLRNDLYRSSQKEVYYYIQLDIHHYFPRMNHGLLHVKVDNTFKEGKLRRFVHRVIDSYHCGAPLGIKLAQLFGMLFLADFDRLAEKFFLIIEDPEKMEYWTSRYITEWVMTASTPDEMKILGRGSQYLAARFERFARSGLSHYYRFVDNIIIMHEDKAFLRIVRDIVIMILTRDYLCILNTDYNVRPTWMDIRLCGYIYFHNKLFAGKSNKKELAIRIHNLRKAGRKEEEIRIKLASLLGFVKHSDCINLLIKLGMEKSLGKIIQNRRIRPPFTGMKPNQKVNFSSIVNKENEVGGGKNPIKILLLDYKIVASKIEKENVSVVEKDSNGNNQVITSQQPAEVLAIKFRKIVNTFVRKGPDGEESEEYSFAKERDEDGQLSTVDAEYYAFTGSRIMIDQSKNDFSMEDLPCPTVVLQVKGKDGKCYTKFT